VLAGAGAQQTGSLFARVYETVSLHLHERAANSFLRAQAIVDTVTAGKMAAVAASAAAVAGGGFAVEGAVTSSGERPAALLRGAQGLVSVPSISTQTTGRRSASRTHAKPRTHRASKPHAAKQKSRARQRAQAPPRATPSTPARPQTTTVVHATVASSGGSSRPSSSAAGEFGFEGP
jgi:hypothetical protein